MIPFSPAPSAAELPARFPSPFDRAAVHPLAHRAALEMGEWLASAETAAWRLREPGNGKMFGVLVVQAPDGTVGYLRGCSGMLHGAWDVPGPCKGSESLNGHRYHARKRRSIECRRLGGE